LEKSKGGETVGVRDVADVGEVEDVGVITKLKASFAGGIDVDHWREELDVAFAEDAGRTEGGG